jgi:hypothetical protein
VVAPTAAAAAAAAAAEATTAAPSTAVAPSPRRAATVRAPRQARRDLDPAFAGAAAGVGAQGASFTIDVVVVLAATATVLALTGTTVYAVLAFVEIIAGLWVLEARTGATIGNLVLRLRASRDDAPYSPGVGRSFVRRMLVGVGFLAGGIGAWVVAGSGAWDRTGGKRSWADAAARTLVVAVPRRAERAAATVQTSTTHVQTSIASEPVVLVAPQVVSTLARANAASEDSISQSRTGTPEAAFVGQQPVMAPVEQAVPGDQQAGAPVEPAAGMILLAFDTGQREQFATPVAVNLGRSPVVTEPADVLVTVQNHESTVSKTHLRLEHSRGRTWVTDGNTTNGTQLLDDEGGITTLEPGVRVLLDEGTRVRMGNRAFTVSILLGGEK